MSVDATVVLDRSKGQHMACVTDDGAQTNVALVRHVRCASRNATQAHGVHDDSNSNGGYGECVCVCVRARAQGRERQMRAVQYNTIRGR